jgi:hypothetical protein
MLDHLPSGAASPKPGQNRNGKNTQRTGVVIEDHCTGDFTPSGDSHPDTLEFTFQAAAKGTQIAAPVSRKTAIFYNLNRRKIFRCRGTDMGRTHSPFMNFSKGLLPPFETAHQQESSGKYFFFLWNSGWSTPYRKNSLHRSNAV